MAPSGANLRAVPSHWTRYARPGSRPPSCTEGASGTLGRDGGAKPPQREDAVGGQSHGDILCPTQIRRGPRRKLLVHP